MVYRNGSVNQRGASNHANATAAVSVFFVPLRRALAVTATLTMLTMMTRRLPSTSLAGRTLPANAASMLKALKKGFKSQPKKEKTDEPVPLGAEGAELQEAELNELKELEAQHKPLESANKHPIRQVKGKTNQEAIKRFLELDGAVNANIAAARSLAGDPIKLQIMRLKNKIHILTYLRSENVPEEEAIEKTKERGKDATEELS